MKQTPLLRARVESGQIVWQGLDAKRWTTAIQYLEGKEVQISIAKWQKKRSLNQNRYYHGVVVEMIAEAMGEHNKDEVHDALRGEFLRKNMGNGMSTLISTTTLSTVEFEEYLSKCKQLAAQMYGIYIPDPNEVLEENQ